MCPTTYAYGHANPMSRSWAHQETAPPWSKTTAIIIPATELLGVLDRTKARLDIAVRTNARFFQTLVHQTKVASVVLFSLFSPTRPFWSWDGHVSTSDRISPDDPKPLSLPACAHERTPYFFVTRVLSDPEERHRAQDLTLAL
jgi:hypothetical protein